MRAPSVVPMETSVDIDDLCDHLDWVVELLRLRVATNDADRASAVAGVIAAQATIAANESVRTARSELQARLRLSDTEMQIVWILAAAALDERAKRVLLGSTGLEPALSLESLRRIVYGPRPSGRAVYELGPDGTLRRLRLIERSDSGAGEAHESRWSWTLSRRVLAWLHGDRSVAADVKELLADHRAPDLDQLVLHQPAREQLAQAVPANAAIVLSGTPGMGRRSAGVAVAKQNGRDVLVIDARLLAKDASLEEQCRKLLCECLLLDRTPIVANLDSLGSDAIGIVGRELVAGIEGAVFVTSSIEPPAVRWNRTMIVIELAPLTSKQRSGLWLRALGQGAPEDGELLACRYPLAPALICAAAEAVHGRCEPSSSITPHQIAVSVRTILDDKLAHLARRVEVTQTWEDLVLSEDQLSPILELIARVRERPRVYEEWGFAAKIGRGLGTSALFSGPPGTGKTMVAALIARELGIELYQVDLAKIVSKWVGETEKQLSSLFDAAEAGHAVLLFDEADTLFGRRTEVKSSNDRYANLETNYLLQRLESFTGICVLTSNHESNIDPAFQRRLSLHLRFELPTTGERAQLWRAMIPQQAPLDADVDFALLASRYEMSGGYIRNAALRAAFLAAGDSTPISSTHLDAAARVEYEGMGKLVS